MNAKRREQLRRASETLCGFAAILVDWEYGAGFGRMPEYILPVPSVIAITFWRTLFIQAHHLSVTASTTLIGLALALVIGVLLVLAVIYVRPLKAIVLRVLAAFNSIPKIAIAPLFVIWFGLGLEPKVLLAFLLELFPIFGR